MTTQDRKPKYGDPDYPTPEQTMARAVQRTIEREQAAAKAKHEAEKAAAIANGTWVEPPPPPTHRKEWVMVAVIAGKQHRITNQDPSVVKAAYNKLFAAYPNITVHIFLQETPL